MLVQAYNIIITLIQMRREEPSLDSNDPNSAVIALKFKERLKRIIYFYAVLVALQTASFSLYSAKKLQELI